eukprot:m.209203 g.209203  ORF g.209203 m.209203 type:complete len:569 (-) comp33030_c3_seq15:48-1754(-)
MAMSLKDAGITPTEVDSRNSREREVKFSTMGTGECITFFVHNPCYLHFSELFYTFFEHTRIPKESCSFLLNGHIIDITQENWPDQQHPTASGYHITDLEIDVVFAPNKFSRRLKCLFHMNKLAEKLALTRVGVDDFPLSVELVDHVMSFFDVEDLWQCCQVSTLFHTVAYRRALLIQLSEGNFGWASQQGYPAFLGTMGDLSFRLSKAELGVCAAEQEVVKKLKFRKEMPVGHYSSGSRSFSFAKASGCTIARTVILDHDQLVRGRFDGVGLVKLKELCDKFNVCVPDGENNLQTLRTMVEQAVALKEPQPATLAGVTKTMVTIKKEFQQFNQAASQLELAPPKLNDVDERTVQVWPLQLSSSSATSSATTTSSTMGKKHERVVAEAVDAKVLDTVIEMYMRYFSPDMQYVFPLIVYRGAALGLDFTTTRTWGMFDADNTPKGAVSWRIRRSPTEKICDSMGIARAVEPVAEILFIAVWERQRDNLYGSDLVTAIAQKALAQGVRLLYVEIGTEQPKARRFWGKNDFKLLPRSNPEAMSKLGITEAQARFFDSVCFRFSDTQQYVKVL